MEKTLAVPAATYRTYTIPAGEIRAGGIVRSVHLEHARRENGAFICAEQIAKVYELTMQVSKLFCTESDNYAYEGGRLFYLEEGTNRTGFSNLNRVVEYKDADGETFSIAVGASRCYKLMGTTIKTIGTTTGGTCAAFHHERIFIGNGTRINYSAALSYDTFSDRSTQSAGFLDLPPDAFGNILEIVPFGERLLLFREYGVSAFTAFADPLNFKAAPVCACPKIVKGSVARCGDSVFFFTERGLYAYRGGACERVKNADDGEIDLTKPIWGGSERGNYYASVTVRNAGKLYAYDTLYAEGRYLDSACEALASCREVYFVNGKAVYKLLDKDVGSSRECSVTVSFAFGEENWKETFLEEIEVCGTGPFAITLKDAAGNETLLSGKAGKYRLPKALRGGEFSLKIAGRDRFFRVDKIGVRTRRDRRL